MRVESQSHRGSILESYESFRMRSTCAYDVFYSAVCQAYTSSREKLQLIKMTLWNLMFEISKSRNIQICSPWWKYFSEFARKFLPIFSFWYYDISFDIMVCLWKLEWIEGGINEFLQMFINDVTRTINDGILNKSEIIQINPIWIELKVIHWIYDSCTKCTVVAISICR